MATDNGKENHFDYDTLETGAPFLVGYRKFIVAILWMLLMGFGVIMALAVLPKPSAGQTTIVIWLVASSGFFCAFFVGGNTLAKLWAQNYRVTTTATLDHSTEQVDQTVKYQYIDPREDAAFADQEKDLPAAKPRKRS